MLNRRMSLRPELLWGFGLGRRCLTATAPTSAQALRHANVFRTSASARERLAQLSRPFEELIAQFLAADQPGSAAAFGHGLQPSDLASLGLNPSQHPALTRILSLEMCSPAQARQHYLACAMRMFARRPNDTGSPEVQAALWSMKIAALEAHTQKYRHDYVAARKIVEWRDQRRKILRYLRRVSLERYFGCLDRLGLPHDLVEAATSRFPRMPVTRKKTAKGLLKLQAQKKS